MLSVATFQTDNNIELIYIYNVMMNVNYSLHTLINRLNILLLLFVICCHVPLAHSTIDFKLQGAWGSFHWYTDT